MLTKLARCCSPRSSRTLRSRCFAAVEEVLASLGLQGALLDVRRRLTLVASGGLKAATAYRLGLQLGASSDIQEVTEAFESQSIMVRL